MNHTLNNVEEILINHTAIKAFTIVLLLLIVSPASFADRSKELAALASAENFLQLVDTGHYSESWDAAAAFFKQQVSRQQWVKQLESVRPAFGNLVTRKIKGQNHTTSLPGAPDGEYVVIQFYTSFTHKKNAIETVTPMLEKDGEWRVTGFYIR